MEQQKKKNVLKIIEPYMIKARFWLIKTGWALLAAAAVFALIYLADMAVTNVRIHKGVKVIGLDIGYKTKSQAEKLLKERLDSLMEEPVKITYKNQSWEVRAKQFGFSPKIKETVDEAYELGRHGSLIIRFRERVSLWFYPMEADLVYSVDKKKVERWASGIHSKVEKIPVNATLKISKGEILLVPSQIGLKIDTDSLGKLYPKALVSIPRKPLPLPVSLLPADVTEEGAKAAIDDTKKIISSPVTLKYDRFSWEVAEEELGEIVRFVGSPKLKPVLDKDSVTAMIEEKGKDFRVEPKDAKFQVDGDKVILLASADGKEIDSDRAYNDMSKAVLDEEPRVVVLGTRLVQPKLSTEEARAMKIQSRISKFTTSYKANQTARVHNIHLLATILDGMLIAPGETFSFNERVGERTAEKGFKMAPTIVDGELVDTLGGGVCQVGTTIFNAVYVAGLPVKERHNHSYYISTYPAGRDATVSWGSLDFKFVNDTGSYILIKTFFTGSTLNVSLYGTKTGRTVVSTSSGFSNLKPFEQEIEEDPNLDEGTENITQKGIEGREITITRKVLLDGKVIKTDKFFSRYKPRKEIVVKGTREVLVPTGSTTGTTSSGDSSSPASSP